MTSYNLFLANFHFLRPLWLLAIIALFLVLWLLKKHHFHQSPWQKFLPSHLSRVLVEGATNNPSADKHALHERVFLVKPFFIGLLSIIALAGPVWQKLPQPVYQTERGSVLIMDMSYSMYSTDIKPNRLTRSRFKAIDLLNKINNGDVGLIAYAGDAFIISPLTQDIKNIELLLPSLTPEIMPEVGSNPYAALTLAHEMLINAGHLTGDIYWFTDDVDNEELSDIFDWSSEFAHHLNILGIGSPNGAPIKLPSGELLKDNNGAIVVPRLPTQKLQSLASRGAGRYQTISNDDSDIDSLILKFDALENNKSKQQQSQQTGDQWQEQGAWLLLLVLPLALSYFRRGGAILVLPLTCFPLLFSLSFSLISPVSYANENIENNPVPSPSPSSLTKAWQNLWQTKDQQAQQQYNQENYQSAAQQFENSQWQGSAHYKAGNYQQALDAFKQGKQANSADGLYNQGNALAQMQKYQQAIDAYEQALKKNPELQDAKDNLEKIKQQQEQQKQEQEQEQSDQSKDDKSKDDDQNQKQDQDQDQDQDQQSQDKSEKQQDQQPSEDSTSEPQEKDSQEEQSQNSSESENEKNETEQKQDQQQAEQDDKLNEQGKEKTAAQLAAEQQAKETNQKHQQLLNKVTDDPYLLLRNKMKLEYQKRRQDGARQGVKKKW